MTILPGLKPTATAAGQTATPLTDAVIDAAVDQAIQEARRLDTTPQATIGATPAVPQPGRPPMSQGATDLSALMLSGGVASVLVGGSVSLVMIASGHADPTVCAIAFGSPAAFMLTASRLMKRMKGVLPAEVHNHYDGPVYQDQRNVDSKNYGLYVKNDHREGR